MSEAFTHVTVLLHETVDAIAPRDGRTYLDATLGGGGHAEAVLAASAPAGRLIGVDRDPRALEAAQRRLHPFGGRAQLVHGEMAELATILRSLQVDRVDGVIADLGVSSPQLDEGERGFSFTRPGPLDMRMDQSRGETARDLILRLDDNELADVLFQLGEERRSRRIARSVKRAADLGEMETTDDLRRAVVRAVGHPPGRIDPATRTFQALRIAVNDELGQLRSLLGLLPDILADGAVAAVISFHSLEDRIVKHTFRSDARLEPLTKKPIIPSEAECHDNPRSRSAKLRAARRVPRAVAA